MTQLAQKIIVELEKLSEEQQKKIYDYILFVENEEQHGENLKQSLINGYKYLAEEHNDLVENYGGNDIIE